MASEKVVSIRISQDQYDRLFLYCYKEKLDISAGLKRFIDGLPLTEEQLVKEIEFHQTNVALLQRKLEALKSSIPPKNQIERTEEKKKHAHEDTMKIKSDLVKRIGAKYDYKVERQDEELIPVIKDIDNMVAEVVDHLEEERKNVVLKAVTMLAGYYFHLPKQRQRLQSFVRYFR